MYTCSMIPWTTFYTFHYVELMITFEHLHCKFGSDHHILQDTIEQSFFNLCLSNYCIGHNFPNLAVYPLGHNCRTVGIFKLIIVLVTFISTTTKVFSFTFQKYCSFHIFLNLAQYIASTMTKLKKVLFVTF